MATLDFTVARPNDTAGVRRRVVFKYTGPASYSTGGDAIAAGDLKLGTIEYFPSVILFKAVNDVLFGEYNYTSGKLVLQTANNAEASGDLSGYSARIEVIGK